MLVETADNLIPEGYRKTELGLIPLDWEAVELGEVSGIRMCKRIFSYQTSEAGEIPFFKIGTFGRQPDAYISKSTFTEYKSKYSYPQKGDILLSAAGTLGRTVVFDGVDAYFQDSNIVWLDVDKTRIKNEYLFHYYQVIQWASPEGSTIARLYNGVIRATKVALPPLAEQTAIANALSDVDTLIEELEKLIIKKQSIKTATMQQLLTGKTRLPEFAHHPDGSAKGYKTTELGEIPEGWEAVELGQLLAYEQPTKYLVTSSEYLESGSVPVLTAGKSFLLGYTEECYGIFDNLPAIIFDDFTTDAKLVTFPFKVKSSAIKMLKPRCNSLPIDLIYYLLQRVKFIVGDHKRHWISEFTKIKVLLPSATEEQFAIATVLSDMDVEIEQLQNRLNKTRSIKQGMMQELLTGKTRLPLAAEA